VHTQTTLSNTVLDLISHLHAGSFISRLPSRHPSSFHQQSLNMHLPSLSTSTASHPHINEICASPSGGSNAFTVSHGQAFAPSPHPLTTIPITTYHGLSMSPSLRYQTADNSCSPRNISSGSKRQAPSSPADSSNLDKDNGELPAVAPWEVLMRLADIPIERATQVSFHQLICQGFWYTTCGTGKW
jgi:hypothetical protein